MSNHCEEKEPINLLYEEVLNIEHMHEKSYYELEFIIDGMECFYFFHMCKVDYHDEESTNKYAHINCGIKIKNVFPDDNDDDEVMLGVRSCKVSDGIEGFKKLINRMNSLRKNNKIVIDYNGVSLVPNDIYYRNIKYGSVFNIELNKCYLCHDLVLNTEKLDCGHHIHLKCAVEMFKKNNNIYKCGICRKSNHRIYLKNCDDEENN